MCSISCLHSWPFLNRMIPLYASLYEFVFANQTLIFIPFEMYVVIYECNLSSIEERATAAT